MTTRILLVEDNAADARLLEEYLLDVKEYSYELTHVETLQAGIASASGHDVVLLDLSLPDAAGIETLVRMHAAVRSMPIIVLTGRRDDRTALDAVAGGAQDYLLKDELNAQLIVKSVRYAIERKKAEEQAVRLSTTHEALVRAHLVADVTAAASCSLDLAACMRQVSRRLVPAISDYCVIEIPRATGAFECVAHAATDPALAPLLEELCASSKSRPRPEKPVLDAIETRETILVPDLDILGASPDRRSRELWSALQIRTQMVTPLVVGDLVVAVITYANGPSARTFTPNVQALAEEIAGRVALALDNARLFTDAQRALKGRDELLAIVSHDLRNPLGVVDLALQLISAEPSSLETSLPRARRAVARMKRLIEDLLEVSRIDAGTLRVDPQRVDLVPLLEELAEQHRVLCGDKKLELARDFPTELGTIDADRHRLAQALANLLGNAIKFTPAGGTIRLIATSDDHHVRIVVADTGAGIAEEHLGHIFDRFWQAPQRTRDGVGLGLAIVKGIVDAHHGTIDVQSELGTGTTFTIVLPRRLNLDVEAAD